MARQEKAETPKEKKGNSIGEERSREDDSGCRQQTDAERLAATLQDKRVKKEKGWA